MVEKVYFHLLSLALVNAHKHYVTQNSEHSNQSMPMSAFLKAAINELVKTRSRIQVEGLAPPIIQLATDNLEIYFLNFGFIISLKIKSHLLM